MNWSLIMGRKDTKTSVYYISIYNYLKDLSIVVFISDMPNIREDDIIHCNLAAPNDY